MTMKDCFTVYQMKPGPETRQMRFRSYEILEDKGIQVTEEFYDKVYTGMLHPGDTPESVRERLEGPLPHDFSGHSVSVSDVLVFDRAGTMAFYYVEKNGFTMLEDFFRKDSSTSGAAVSIDTVHLRIEGKAGTWLAFDSIVIAGQEFFLMEHETYGKDAAWVVVDGTGRLAADNVRNGFDREVKRKLEEYLHLPSPQSDRETFCPPQKESPGRESVLAKLHRKQAEIAGRNRGNGHQQTVEK